MKYSLRDFDREPTGPAPSFTAFCQCEHACHPNEDDATLEQRHSKTQHPYGMEPFRQSDMVLVKTIYGDYLICRACNEDHPIPAEYRKSEE